MDRAWIAKQKMLSKTDGTRTASQITFEIMRLERKNRMIKALMNVRELIPMNSLFILLSETSGDNRT